MNKISFYKTQSDPCATKKELFDYLKAIEEIQEGKVMQYGGGVESKAYLKNGKVYLSKPTFPNEPYSSNSSGEGDSFGSIIAKTMLLKSFGISIPRQILRTTIKPTNHQYSVYDQAPGIFLDSKLNRDQFILYKQRELGEYNVPFLQLQKDMANFSLQSLKDRVINGKKHLPKAFRDFSILNMLNVFNDVHGGNIFYDQEKGYTFLDLSFTNFPEEIKCKNDLKQYIKTHSFFSTKDFDFKAFTKEFNCYPIIRSYNYNLFLADTICYNHSDDNFEGYIYNGILLEQSMQMIKDYAKKFGIEKEEDIENYCNTFLENKPFLRKSFMPLSDLQELYSVAKSNGKLPENFIDRINSYYKSTSGTDAYFSISTNEPIGNYLNIPDLKKAMATLNNPEFDYTFINKSNAILEDEQLLSEKDELNSISNQSTLASKQSISSGEQAKNANLINQPVLNFDLSAEESSKI